MKELQRMFDALDRDPKGGKLLPTAELAQALEAAAPLDGAGLDFLARCLEECSEQSYEFYRPMADLFRREIRRAEPAEKTVRAGIALGLLDDEEWPLKGGDDL